MKCLLPILCFALAANAANLTLIPTGAAWKYLDNGSNQGITWRGIGFDDAAWKTGPAQLGYGDGDEATVVNGGPSTSRYVTTYFRHSFQAAGAESVINLILRVVRDDGVVVYLNGTEVYRNNMPSGTINYNTWASSAIGNTDESAFYQANIDPALLVEGANVLAAEVHQVNATSSDVSFDLGLTGDRPDMTITLNGPLNEVTSVGLAPALDVSVSHRVAGTPMTATFHVRALPPIGPDFTIVALPDTQFYSSSLNGGSPQTFIGQTEWIIANQVARNIAFVTQLGDCVQNGDTYESEWWNATNALYRLEDTRRVALPFGMPYGVAVGNHDQSPIGSATGTSTFFNKYFGVAHFTPYAFPAGYYGGNFGSNNDEHYELFSASGIDFIIIHFEYDTAMTVNSPELDWADNLLKQHGNRQAILVAHYFMNSGEGGSFSAQGAAVYNRLKVNPNLFMMLCGHVNPNGEGKRTDVYNGSTVYTLLSDYQDRANGGNGWLRLLEFSPANSRIRVKTYSPLLNQYETDSNSQFELPYDMLSIMGTPFIVAAVNSGITGGSTTAQLNDLNISTDYEWYVSLSDGQSTLTSPRWRFRTADVTPPAAPSVLAGAPQSSTEVYLTWVDNSSNETGFQIYQITEEGDVVVGDVPTDSTTTVVAGLAAETPYQFYVRSFNQAGFSDPSNTDTVTTLAPPPPPAAPTGLQAVAPNDSSVTLTWSDNSDNETGFRLERALDGGVFTHVVGVPANTANFIDSGLSANTSYTYRIAATNDGGSSEYAVSGQVTTQLPPVPGVPQGVIATGGEGSITVNWQPTPGANRYHVWRSYTAGGPYNELGVYDFIAATTFLDDDVNLFQTAYYRVSAINDGGEGFMSEEVSAVAYSLPQAPTGFEADLADVYALPLKWSTATDAFGYRLERSTNGETFVVVTNLANDGPGDQFYVDAGLEANTTYYYRLYATNEYGSSPHAEVTAKTEQVASPGTPTGVTATAGNGSVTLNWLGVNGAAGYIVKRSGTVAGPFISIGTTSANVYTDSSVVNGTAYWYVVSATNGGGASSDSVAVSAAPQAPPAAPTTLKFSGVTASKIDFTWTDRSSNEQGFRVERSSSSAGQYVVIATLGANVRSYSDTGLSKNTLYYYRISAFNAAGSSGYLSGSKKTSAR